MFSLKRTYTFGKNLFMQNKFPLLKTFILLFTASFFCAHAMAQLPKVNVTTNITTNTTWTSDKIWSLRTKIYVTNGATLTIQPGTVIIGDTIKKGTLIITRGSKIQAVGTPCQPIVFTSSKRPGRRARGDWGGVILLGYAHTNSPGDTNHIEGIDPIPGTLYGGGKNPNCGGGDCPNDADNSGTLQYVRIEFAGVALAPNNEINGLTFGSVGSGTTIDHIQVSFSNDDSYEWFGGTVNSKYLIAFRGIDDDFDTDQGYSGKNQFLFGLRDPKIADISGSKGFESDNDANSSTNLPQTRAVFCNVTVSAGADTTNNIYFVAGAHIRRNSHEYIINSILEGYPEGALIDGTTTATNVLADTMILNNIIANTQESNWIVTTPVNSSVDDLLRNHAGNRFFHGNAGVQLKNPYNLKNPQPWPLAGSPALGNANFNHAVLNDPFFKKVKYIGAFNQGLTNDWTDTWANWDPINTDYSNGVPSTCVKTTPAETQIVAPVADVKVSPNPSQGAFNVAVKGFNASTVNVKIADLNTGKIYFIGKANNNSTTNINVKIPNGNYVVELTDGKTVISRKITVLN
jgi:hypothetical protein